MTGKALEPESTSTYYPEGWTVSNLNLMGPQGVEFVDARDVEHLTGRPFDEFRLYRLQVAAWSTIGAVRTVYQSTVDGLVVQCPLRGHLGSFAGELVLGMDDWIVRVSGLHGASAWLTGGQFVDRLTICTQSGQGTYLSGSAANGQDKEEVGLSCGAGDGVVVRALEGRASDSLDGVRFVLGPPLPATWSPGKHRQFPRRIREIVKTMLLMAQRDPKDCMFGMLNGDCLLRVIEYVAAPFGAGFALDSRLELIE